MHVYACVWVWVWVGVGVNMHLLALSSSVFFCFVFPKAVHVLNNRLTFSLATTDSSIHRKIELAAVQKVSVMINEREHRLLLFFSFNRYISMCMSVCVCLFAPLFVCLFIYLFVCLFVCALLLQSVWCVCAK